MNSRCILFHFCWCWFINNWSKNQVFISKNHWGIIMRLSNTCWDWMINSSCKKSRCWWCSSSCQIKSFRWTCKAWCGCFNQNGNFHIYSTRQLRNCSNQDKNWSARVHIWKSSCSCKIGWGQNRVFTHTSWEISNCSGCWTGNLEWWWWSSNPECHCLSNRKSKYWSDCIGCSNKSRHWKVWMNAWWCSNSLWDHWIISCKNIWCDISTDTDCHRSECKWNKDWCCESCCWWETNTCTDWSIFSSCERIKCLCYSNKSTSCQWCKTGQSGCTSFNLWWLTHNTSGTEAWSSQGKDRQSSSFTSFNHWCSSHCWWWLLTYWQGNSWSNSNSHRDWVIIKIHKYWMKTCSSGKNGKGNSQNWWNSACHGRLDLRNPKMEHERFKWSSNLNCSI